MGLRRGAWWEKRPEGGSELNQRSLGVRALAYQEVGAVNHVS